MGAPGPAGPPGPAGVDGADGADGAGLSGYEIILNNTGWVLVESNTYDMTLACSDGKTALSAGLEGGGALNTIITMRVDPNNTSRGLFRIRVQGGSAPSDQTAQVVCATLGG